MNHEPECFDFGAKEPIPAQDCRECDRLRSAYQRGRENVLNAIQQTRELHKGHLAACNYAAATDEPCDVCAWAQNVLNTLDGK